MTGEKYQINDWGHADFTISKMGIKTKINCYGKISMIDKKYLLFIDNDGYEYIIAKSDFEFTKKEFKILPKKS